jgi:hypothetical protein
MGKGLLLLIALLAASLSANARSLTVFFTGEVVSVLDRYASTDVPSAVGTRFSGYLTYDVADAEYFENTINQYGQPIVRASSDSGCGAFLNGVCVADRGTNMPLVTDYRFAWSGTIFTPFSSALGYQDNTERFNQSVGGLPSAERWAARRGQGQRDMTGDPNTAFVDHLVNRVLRIDPYTAEDIGLLKKPAKNLDQAFNFSVVPVGQENLYFADTVFRNSCVRPSDCPGQYDAGSFELVGTLTTVTFKSGKVQNWQPAP